MAENRARQTGQVTEIASRRKRRGTEVAGQRTDHARPQNGTTSIGCAWITNLIWDQRRMSIRSTRLQGHMNWFDCSAERKAAVRSTHDKILERAKPFIGLGAENSTIRFRLGFSQLLDEPQNKPNDQGQETEDQKSILNQAQCRTYRNQTIGDVGISP